MKNIHKKCDGTGTIWELRTYCGAPGWFGGVYRGHECQRCKIKKIISKFLIAISKFFNKGDNSVTA